MKVVSLNVGLPREVLWHRRPVTTGIYKDPIEGRRTVRRLNVDGDGQADLDVHGGVHKAVYCYPREHYSFWQRELERDDLPYGMFGENFTTEGLDEESVHIGDEFTVGTARVVVTQPRMPCYKLGIRFESDDMVKRFLASRRTGFYVAVLDEGEVGRGDTLERITRDPSGVRVSDITRLYVTKKYGPAEEPLVRKALDVTALPESWKAYFRQRL
jgi:MOSC domain-containing protein YiiM